MPTQPLLPEPLIALSTSVNDRSRMNMVQAQQLMLEHIGDREHMHTGQAEQAQRLSGECAVDLDRLVVGAEQLGRRPLVVR